MTSASASRRTARSARFLLAQWSVRTRLAMVAMLWSAGGCDFYLDSADDDASGQQCGGLAGGTCPSDEFCDYPVEFRCGIADGAGVCQSRPTACPEN